MTFYSWFSLDGHKIDEFDISDVLLQIMSEEFQVILVSFVHFLIEWLGSVRGF